MMTKAEIDDLAIQLSFTIKCLEHIVFRVNKWLIMSVHELRRYESWGLERNGKIYRYDLTWKLLLWVMQGKCPTLAAADCSIWSLSGAANPCDIRHWSLNAFSIFCRKFFSETSMGCFGSKLSLALVRPSSILLPSPMSSLMRAILMKNELIFDFFVWLNQ